MNLFDLKRIGGTYVAVTPSDETLKNLIDWSSEEGFVLDPNPHITILYSRRAIVVKPESFAKHLVKPIGFTALDGADIVLKVQAPSIQLRHEVLRQMGGTHDYPTFFPHLTLKAKAGQLRTPKLMSFDMIFTNEYVEPLDLSHA
jgi:hypothetical protein